MILGDNVHRRAKEYAARHQKTLSALVEEALQERLAGRRERSGKRRVRLPTFRGDGLLPGLSLDDTATLYDRMDRLG